MTVNVIFKASRPEVNLASGDLWKPGQKLTLDVPVAHALQLQGRATPASQADAAALEEYSEQLARKAEAAEEAPAAAGEPAGWGVVADANDHLDFTALDQPGSPRSEDEE